VTYEEDAEGFQFALLPSKKPRPSIEAVRENHHSDVENAPPKSTPKRGRPRKKQTGEKTTTSAVPEKEKSVELPTRRPTRGTAKTTHTEPEFEPTNAIRSSRTRDSPEHQPETKKPKKAGRPPKAKQQAQVSESNGYNSPAQPSEGTKVALPVADTPVIQRNKEFRGGKGDKSEKGRRRSSLSMRGRRASFLIDSGTSNGRLLCLTWAINGRMLIFSFPMQHYPIEKLVLRISTSISPMTEPRSREGCDNY
jgi:kinetochore protein Mis13/DSN1